MIDSHNSAVRAFLRIDHTVDFRNLSLQAGLYWPLTFERTSILGDCFQYFKGGRPMEEPECQPT